MIPYIEFNGNKYEFALNRQVLKEIVKLQSELKIDKDNLGNAYDFLEKSVAEFLKTNYKLTEDEITEIYDSYKDPTELYELLGAVIETVFTNMSAEAENKKPTQNQFLMEYRQKQQTKAKPENTQEQEAQGNV